MMSGTGKSGRAVFKSALASVLALLAFAMCAPQLAFADETTQAINGTMTITLQDGGGSGAGAGVSALGKASSGTATGDALMWLILGVVVLIAGAVYIFIKSRRLAASAGASTNTSSSTSADTYASSKKKTIIVAIITALIACTCFGMFASKGTAFANKGTAVTNDTFSSVFGSSAVEVDSDGNVLSNNITIVNDEDEAIIVKSIEAPSALSNWNADITDKTIESGKVAEGAWDGKTIPASVLEQLKNNDGYAELSFTINVTDAKTTLNFEEFEVDKTAKDYTGQKITPTVSSLIYEYGTDYEVVYGENTNAGVGTITIKGIGDYKGEQTYIFTINKAPLNKSLVLTTVSVEETYDGTPLSAKEATASGLPEGNIVKLEYSLDGTSWIENASSLSITNVSESTNVQIRATSDANYEGTVETTAGLAVTEAPLTVTTPSQEKQYDGTALTAEGSITGFVNGETADFATTGSQTNVGTSDNTYSITWNGTAEQANYTISETVGKLKVTANTTAITVTVGDTSITYNGKVLTGDITVAGVPKGFTYEAKTSGSQQDVGTSKCSVAEFIILDANKNNVTKNFSNITKNEGTLTVNKRVVTLTSESATKTYDGTALTKPTVNGGDPSGDTGFVSGEVTDIKATGTVTNVSQGNVANTITYDTASNFKADNYTITKNEGTLSITAQSIESGASSYDGVKISTPENVTYDGNEHKWVPTVTDKYDNPLKEGGDYNVTYNTDDFTNVGTITVTITGIGNYTGTVTKTYQITEAGDRVAFAIYSASTDGGTLYFFKDTQANIDKAKADKSYKGVAVSDLYEGIESSETVPWKEYSSSITSVKVEATGIAPISTANWFNGCTKLTSADVSKLDTSKTTNMSNMFSGCSALTSVGDISKWTTSAVTDMSSMFNGCSSLTTVGAEKIQWNTSNVETMEATFYGCSNLTADCSAWDVDKVGSHDGFNTDASNVKAPNWKTAFAVYSTDGQLNFYKRATVPTEGGTIEVQPGTTQTVATVYEGIETAEYTDTTVPWTKDHKKEITTVNFVDSIQPNNTGYWFYNLLNLTTVNAKNLDTSNVTSMRTMFSQCKNLQTIEGVSDWKTGSVTDMRKTFKDCISLTADCSKWDVGAVTQRSGFATNASGVTLPSAWSSQANVSVASNSSLSVPATASVIAGDDKTSAVSTTSDNASVVAQNADGNSAINNEETATTEVGSTEGASEATNKASSTSESNTALQEVNCLSALSKENSSEVEMKAVA